jgi:hypothetical protein
MAQDKFLVAEAQHVVIIAHRPKSSWRQAKVIKHLRGMLPNGIPPDCKPGSLRHQLAKCDPDLKSLDWKTLRRAIDQMQRPEPDAAPVAGRDIGSQIIEGHTRPPDDGADDVL